MAYRPVSIRPYDGNSAAFLNFVSACKRQHHSSVTNGTFVERSTGSSGPSVAFETSKRKRKPEEGQD
ncbi:hypothetical protein BJ508DRAFT_413002 [Ascobolus immersus RN42]|uniref:Uncharacterized protein n=1 Tax=Ascobolus immersus RN42 TaxID=1160509 RepID=A0A3N4IQV5_ASCIM|nr:hypothetical protein BJ508DRAFT_413002 [Ascobolus immersus RN42]